MLASWNAYTLASENVCVVLLLVIYKPSLKRCSSYGKLLIGMCSAAIQHICLQVIPSHY